MRVRKNNSLSTQKEQRRDKTIIINVQKKTKTNKKIKSKKKIN